MKYTFIILVVFIMICLTGCKEMDEKEKSYIQINPKIVKNSSMNIKMETKEQNLLQIPLIQQMPELPRGCEVTSLAMLLSYSGENVNKMQLAREIKKEPTPYQKKNGVIYFGNPNDGFVGDMYSFEKPGLGVYHAPVFQLAQRYLGDRAVDLTGQDFRQVTDYVSNNRPVWVIINVLFDTVPEIYWQKWETPSGKIDITYKEHSVLVTGYDKEYIYINDPLYHQKNRRIKKENFINGWEQMGRQAISFQ